MFPYDSIRNFAFDLEKLGRLIRIDEINQDTYESTALVYRMVERMGDRAPGFLAARTKAGGRWYDTPVVGNLYGGYDTIALAFGVDEINESQVDMHNAATRKIESFLQPDGTWKQLAPVTVSADRAPCKEVVHLGDKADIFDFPWIKNNPLDAAQYISAGCFVMQDPDLGKNLGTYRIQIKGSRKVGAYFTNQSHAYAMMMQAAERGEESVKVAIAVGLDPISWMMSSTRLADQGVDELAIAGGFRGKPVELVKCETSDLMVPAHAEFIIEGEIPIEVEQEGPYGEMFGYLGAVTNAFYVNITAITYRRDPWVYNIYTGAESGYFTLPWDVGNLIRLKKLLPTICKLHTPANAPTIGIISIKKMFPGQGLEAGMLALGYRMYGFSKKLIIIVDDDVEPSDMPRVLHAVATRWQPQPASLMVNQAFHMPIDPSLTEMFKSSKFVIDATRQLPSEGGPETFPHDLKTALRERVPEAFALVDEKWDNYFRNRK